MRKLIPFRRSDGVIELAIIGNLGLAYAYTGSEKVTHFIEDTDVDTNVVHQDTYYIQLDDGFTLPEYKSKGVHLIRNIEEGDDVSTCEVFKVGRDGDDEDDWVEEEFPASDFQYLNNREKLVPMKVAEKYNEQEHNERRR